MASNYYYYESSASQSDTESDVELNELVEYNAENRKQRAPKSRNRNAQIARENRLKKKRYIENLEREVTRERKKCKRYSTLLKEQAAIMDKQDREIKYMKGILANNTDICKLLRGIYSSTGMPVGTSINKNVTVLGNSATNSDQLEVEAMTSLPANIIVKAIHPWSDAQFSLGGLSADELGLAPCFDDFHLPTLDVPLDDALLDSSPLSPSPDDHNYTQTADNVNEESFGICLHISNHKLSLEYCAQCHENSAQLWNEEEANAT